MHKIYMENVFCIHTHSHPHSDVYNIYIIYMCIYIIYILYIYIYIIYTLPQEHPATPSKRISGF